MVSLLVFASLFAAPDMPPLENAMPVRFTGPWTVAVGPGSVAMEEDTLSLPAAVSVEVLPAAVIEVRGECHSGLPVYNDQTAGWVKGAKLRALITEECSQTGALRPETLRLRPSPGKEPFAAGTDYAFDAFWGTFGRVEGGTIAPRQTVYADYDYSPSRLDSIVMDGAGQVHLRPGPPSVGVVLPPELSAGERAIVNVWVPGNLTALTEDNLYPIGFAETAPATTALSQAEQYLPKTLAKLRAGEPVTIVAWGDSVTNGGGVGERYEAWYQNQFAVRLAQRFPKADIRLLTAAWGGASSQRYLDQPRGAEYDFVRDVLEPKPDLVTIEFVNDAYLDEEKTQTHYAGILEQIRGVGAEVALIAPHLVRPDWLKVDHTKVQADPRPFVKGLHRFAAENQLALADASTRWCRLWRQGIPYTTLLANSINHPDVRGQAIFADALMALFPEE